MESWERRIISGPQRGIEWSSTSLGAGWVAKSSEGLRVLVGGRGKDNRSRIGEIYFFEEGGSARFSPLPLVDVGESGSLTADGVSYPSLFGQEEELMFVVGWQRIGGGMFANTLLLAERERNLGTFRVKQEPLFPRLVGRTGSAAALDMDGAVIAVTVFDGWLDYSERKIPTYKVWWAEKQANQRYRLIEKIGGLPSDPRIAVAKPSFLNANGHIFAWFSVRIENAYHVVGGHLQGGSFSEIQGLNLLPSESGWDSTSVEYAHFVKSADRIIGVYNGNGFGRSGIGVATATERILEGE